MPENMSQSDIDSLIKSLLTGDQPSDAQTAQPAPAAPPADAAAAAMAAPAPAPAQPIADLGPITEADVANANAAYDAAKSGVTATPNLIPPVIEVEPRETPNYIQPAPPASQASSVDELVSLLSSNHPDPVAPPPAPASPPAVTAAPVAQAPAHRPAFPSAGVPVTVSILMDVRLTLTVRLGLTHMHLKDVLNLAPGAVITLESLATEPLDVLINNIPVMKAEAVVMGENYGVRIAETMIHSQLAAS